VTIETARLRLRELAAGDAPFILTLLNEPSFIQNIGDRGVRSLEDARAYIANGPVASYVRFGFGLYLVELRESGAPIGICGILKRDALPDPDLGFAFLPGHWKQGYAFESAAAVRHYARATGRRASACDREPGERRVHRLLGFSFERMARVVEDRPDVKVFVDEGAQHG
jgi:RimJ/RimL family protein N-acetyltransferase